ncbi:cold-shock protein [Alkalilacustris brevis]|uniref:cold-shock protein n=1 Tax=Alkalilacustris brevis TaxID=2026338 RepID=UPI000E0DC66A|nr:cold shock domain-containing protein [Alkalilacustris brevis]
MAGKNQDEAGGAEGWALEGQVKWFDPGKGFGFIVAEDGGPDILLHANVLRGFGQGSVSDGTAIRVAVQETPRGLQATQVLEILGDRGAPFTGFEELEDMSPEDIAKIDLAPARVKWFDKSKGFGFANVFGCGKDVFLHIEVLRRSGFAELQPGEALSLRIIEGRRGLMAVHAAPWEAALNASNG